MSLNLQQEYIEACDQVNRLARTLKERDVEIERARSQALADRSILTQVRNDLRKADADIVRLTAEIVWLHDVIEDRGIEESR
jgi:hypothetical protein